MSTTIGGIAAQWARVVVPSFGVWHVEAALVGERGVLALARVDVVIGDLTMVGTVLSVARHDAEWRALVVGGAGWYRELPAQPAYRQAKGVRLSEVARDLGRDAGEEIVVSADRVLGESWARPRGPASARVADLSRAWRVAETGKTHLDGWPVRDVPAGAKYTIDLYDVIGGRAVVKLADEAPRSWLPGARFATGESGTLTARAVVISSRREALAVEVIT